MKYIQKVTMILITGLLLTLIIIPIQSAMAADPIRIFIDNKEVAAEVQPMIVNDRTMVPLRVISENLGMTVDWDGDTRSVLITSPGNFIPGEYIDNSLSDGANISIFIDGVYIESEVKPFIKNDRTMVPLRVISEGLGMEVNWDGKERLVSINSPIPVLPSRHENVPLPMPVPEPMPAPEPVKDLPEEISTDSQLLYSLASYKTNLKLKDGSVINSVDLLNRRPSDFSSEQLSVFRTYLSQLSKYEPLIRLPDGSMVNTADVTIMGEAYLTAEQLTRWIKKETPRLMDKAASNGREFQPIPDLADLYIKIGTEYGVRGDIAYCQAAKETGYWQFTGSVQPDQNNYCGLWATGNPLTGQESLNGADSRYLYFEAGRHGATFISPEAGVEAHIQHLFAYANRENLPAGKNLLDPRYALVKRGLAPTWLELNARWAVPGTTYGQSILADYWLNAAR